MTETVITEALERFKESQDGSDFNREDYDNDIKFARLGDQWPEKVKTQRDKENRPCLTINKLPSFIRQVVNDARQNKPSIQVHPVDNGADEDTAEVINGIVRSIERRSSADVAYDTAIDHAVSGGMGFFRIGLDYAHEESFDLECRIHRVPNPLAVHWDVNSTEFDSSDWMYAFYSEFLSEDEFEARFPKADKVSFEGDTRDAVNLWMEDKQIRVAEYWERIEKKRKLLLLSNGGVVREDLFKDEVKALAEVQGVEVTREREAVYYEVKRRVINGFDILDEDDWPGSYIPIIPVWGEEVIVDGRRHFRSMVRDAKDPQTMFNYWRTASTELVALAPKAPFIGPKGAFKSDKAKWESANTRSWSNIEYDGNIAPQRQAFAGVPAGALQEALNASDDMKAIIGIYDSSLGARSNETSGKAIMARQREADVANFHFIDNLNRAIRQAGRVLVELIPHVYKDRQVVRILGEDMTEKVANLANGTMETASMPTEDGEDTLYDLSVGKYDVDIKSGPSYGTQREETREALIEIMRAVPDAALLLGDILMEHMDFQGADKVAERLKLVMASKGIPPDPGAAPQGAVPGQPPPMPQPNPGPPGQPAPPPNGGVF